MGKPVKPARLVPLLLLPLLAACKPVVLSPAGDIAMQQRDLLVISTLLMLLIIVPVMALTIFFAWKYRESNRDADYRPDWHHSTQLELVIWAAPLLIIICLGALTWVGTHLLDPYRPLDRVSKNQPVTAEHQPLEVEVVAMDWKWLFIYPEEGIATVNELAAPVDRPIRFKITGTTVMNAFYVPALSGMIYAMPGMQTQLNAVINAAGEYEGFSANYSGHGFSHMRFAFHGVSDADYDTWVAKVRESGQTLDRTTYLALAQPSENNPVAHYAGVDANLFRLILNMCVEEGRMCMNEMAAIDARGGAGLAGTLNTRPFDTAMSRREPTVFGGNSSFVETFCTVEDSKLAFGGPLAAAELPKLRSRTPIRGHGLSQPPLLPGGLMPSSQAEAEQARPSAL